MTVLALIYRKAPPTTTGKYWFKGDYQEPVMCVVKRQKFLGGVLCGKVVGYGTLPVVDFRGEWAGPIE